jgi:hypothetical protein
VIRLFTMRLAVPVLCLVAVLGLSMPSAGAQPACLGVVTAESGLFGRCDGATEPVDFGPVVDSTGFAPMDAGATAAGPAAPPVVIAPRTRLASLDTGTLSERTMSYAAIIAALLMVQVTLARLVRRRSVALAS